MRTSPDLRTKLHIRTSNNGSITVASDFAGAKIAGINSGQIILYLPNNPRERERSFRSTVLPGFQQLLGVEQETALLPLSQLLTSRLGQVNDILLEIGAPRLSWIDPIELPEESAFHESETTEDVVQPRAGANATSIHSRGSSAPSPLPFSPRQPPQGFTQDDDDVAEASSGLYMHRSAQRIVPILRQDITTSQRDIEYTRLLYNVMRVARGATPLQELQIDSVLAFGSRDDAGSLRNEKIGAAGELFVYEKLRRLGIQQFGYQNWQSKIRRHISVTNQYQTMSPWTGPDLDIVVEDESFNVAEWLEESCQQGLPDTLLSLDRGMIRFEFEVKTTIGACSDRMFMSHAQYQRVSPLRFRLSPSRTSNNIPQMHRHHVQFDNTKTIFVLARVYDLLSPVPKLALFVDPTRFMGSTLLFNSETTWHVEAQGI